MVLLTDRRGRATHTPDGRRRWLADPRARVRGGRRAARATRALELVLGLVLGLTLAISRPPVAATSTRPQLPVRSYVLRGFDPPAQRWLPGHRGIDLAARAGAVVRAPAGGVIRFAGSIAGVGYVNIVHPGGLTSTYQPVQPLLPVGAPVAPGLPFAVLTFSGHCGLAACLHWGAKISGDYVNPLVAFQVLPRLLPP